MEPPNGFDQLFTGTTAHFSLKSNQSDLKYNSGIPIKGAIPRSSNILLVASSAFEN